MPAARPIAPKARKIVPQDGADAVVNQALDRDGNPTKKFCLVQKGDGPYCVGHYEQMGWEVVPRAADGPRLAGVSRKGGDAPHQEWMGCILMSIDVDEYERINRVGLSGRGGTEFMERIDRQMSAPFKAREDIPMVNETTPGQFVREA